MPSTPMDPPTLDTRRRQAGYMLLVVLVMLAMLVLILATAMPRMTTQIRRQREKDMVFRAKQYVIGIQRYYHKFGAYPPNLSRLKATNGEHFLRRAWRDPMTRNGHWFFVHYGQVPVSATGGIGAPPNGLNPGGMGSMGGGLGGMANPGSGPGAGADNPAPAGSQPFGANLPGTNPANGPNDSGLVIATLGAPNVGLTDSNGHKKPSGFGACHANKSASAMLGGGPIIGVASRSDTAGILVFAGHARPCKWAFIYDPSKDKTLHVMPGAPGQLPNGAAPPNPGVPLGGTTGGPPPPALPPAGIIEALR
jgi:type II secretory pathway pseudopilin PulG